MDLAEAAEEIENNGGSGETFSVGGDEASTYNELGWLRLVLRDMVESMKAKDELIHSIVHNQRELIHRWRPDYSITFVNQAFCEFFNRSEEDWLMADPAMLEESLKTEFPELFKIINQKICAHQNRTNPFDNSFQYTPIGFFYHSASKNSITYLTIVTCVVRINDIYCI